MYIAIHVNTFRKNPERALKWRLQAETFTDLLIEFEKEERRTGYKWNEYAIFTV